MKVQSPTPLTILSGRFPRLLPQLPEFNQIERERQEYARYCRDTNPHRRPLSLEQWRRWKAERGNQEGQNHD